MALEKAFQSSLLCRRVFFSSGNKSIDFGQIQRIQTPPDSPTSYASSRSASKCGCRKDYKLTLEEDRATKSRILGPSLKVTDPRHEFSCVAANRELTRVAEILFFLDHQGFRNTLKIAK